MRNQSPDKICEICGNKGVGRNFGAITCESCKAFFRRNSLKNKEFIQNDKQKELRRIAIEENKRKRNNGHKLAKTSSTSDQSDEINGVSVDMFSKIFENNKKIYKDVIALNKCINDSMDVAPIDMNQKYVFNQFITPLLRPINTYKEWSDGEYKWVTDLSLASAVFRNPSTQKYIKVQTIHQFYQLWGNRIEFDTQNIVKFTKSLTQCSNICHNDQIALVKYSSMELIVLRANIYYDEHAKNWTQYIDDEYSFVFPMHLLIPEKRDLYNSYKNYFNKMLPEWNKDIVILDLLSAIVLFNPNRPNMVNREAVMAKQKMYVYLLQRYLMIKYHWEWQSKSKMANLMNSLPDLQLISAIEVENGVEEYLHYFGPLLSYTKPHATQVSTQLWTRSSCKALCAKTGSDGKSAKKKGPKKNDNREDLSGDD
ncbi:unnamed protein product [Oppiella nova]|uniref:Uncharacterized protein n=1 Tax=Oppiella nova TaxID=334625 RepID=A0A7R9M3H9_9ACAR|nr:unnamed protein product [Oppiella nova]CAG2170071.1 unnamed protein product [Oppiella nova]